MDNYLATMQASTRLLRETAQKVKQIANSCKATGNDTMCSTLLDIAYDIALAQDDIRKAVVKEIIRNSQDTDNTSRTILMSAPAGSTQRR